MDVTVNLGLDALDFTIRAVDATPEPPDDAGQLIRAVTLSQLLWAYAHAKAASLPAGPITKWDALHPIDRDQLDGTPFTLHDPTGKVPSCSKCGTPLPTEGAFARHYRVTNRRYLNLGDCPNG